MDLSIDVASRERVRGLSALGSAQIRPLGLEADRLGRPTPADHPFFELLLRAGQGRTRWNGREKASVQKTEEAKEGTSRTVLLLAEEMSYWDRGVAVSFPGPGLGVRVLCWGGEGACSMETEVAAQIAATAALLVEHRTEQDQVEGTDDEDKDHQLHWLALSSPRR